MSPRSAALASTARGVLVRHDGVAHLQRFLEAGLERRDVAHLRRVGVLVRPRIGWYVDPAVPEAGQRAVRVGGVLACTAAAAAWGIAVPEGGGRRLEVALRRGSTRLRRSDDAGRRAWADSEPEVRWHWELAVEPAHGWRSSPLDAVLQLAACVPFRWLVAAIDSARCPAQRPPLLDRAAVRALRDALPERLRSAVDRSDPRSETSGETFLRLELEDRGVPFVPQVRLTSAYRADGVVDGWLPVEIDGLATHAGREAVAGDRERDALLAWHGVPPLRFLQSQAVRDPAWVGETVERVWRRGAPPGLRR